MVLLSLAGIANGLSQVVNKKLTSSGHESVTYTAAVLLTCSLFSLPLFFYQPHISLSLSSWSLIFISITVFAFSTRFGFEAYKHADVSTVSILQRFNILFVALIGFLFLQENYTLKSIIGLLLIFFSGIILVFNKRKIQMNIGTVFVLLMVITNAIASALDKLILNDFSPYSYLFINNFLSGTVFLYSKKNAFQVKNLFQKRYPLILTTSALSTISVMLVWIVLQQTSVSQTMPVYKGLALIIPVVIGITLLNERQQLSQKLIGATLGIIGIVLQY